jgi:acetolactate synthase I/II/III large subunit
VSNSRFVFEFEGFQLDTRSQSLRSPHDGRQLALKPKEFEVLLFFVEHAGDLIAKETLLTSLWPGQVVEENNLNQYVTVLRKLLGEERGGRRFIMNVRAKGYRFVPQVLQLQVNSANDSANDSSNESDGGVANAPTYSIYESSKHSQPTNNLIAWQCYQHGMHLLNTDSPERWSEAVTLFERAISLDADFGSAYAQLALTIIRLFVFDHPRAIGALGKARDAAKRAVELRPGEMDSALVLGTINAIAGIWVEAEQNFVAGRDFDREWVMAAAMHSGYVLLSVGHLQRALAIGRKYLLDLQGVTSLAAMQAAVCVLAGNNDDARQVMELAVAMGTDLRVPPMPDALCMYHARHEQGAALMAYGYAHVSGKIGTLLVVPGPGFLNATTGILTAHACNNPMLCLVGQSERMFIGSGVGVLHELQDQIGIAGSLTKWSVRVELPAQVNSQINQAISEIRSFRPRPVYVELPSDVVRMTVNQPELAAAPTGRRVPVLQQAQVETVAKALAAARFPLVIAGGGATSAGPEVLRLAELLGAPVGMSENGLGTVDARHRLAFSQLGAHKLWAKADVVLALGTRLFAPIYNWGWDADMQIFKVDIDITELHRLPTPLYSLHADVREFVAALCEALPKYLQQQSSPQRRDLSSELAEARAQCAEALAGLAFPRRIVEAIRTELGEDGILVADVTQLNHAALDMYPVYKPHTYISSGYQGTLGFGPCTALGAKIAKPAVPVVCLVGDGGFMYACQELATAVQFNIAVVMLVINDGAYKNVEMCLDRGYGGRAIATTLKNPDFLKFADSFGVVARRVTTPEDMQLALRELIALNQPAVIDYQIGDIPSAFWLRFLPQVRKYKPENPFALVQK